ncbi:nitroreductase family protein [Dermatobacter hominis]|uniref:nitroreductase family protein n=1 Tax=Dermatobacter hominis TaxID=2884263 RepID=UPI001D118852|nr:nitroreductase family protein [Dermatobacter hominis]UDY35994.1 nitroreductase family protein [Dermatobacter hominis]
MTDPNAGPADGAPTFASVLAGRRMCRDFLADPVPDDVLRRVLAAAFRGPSAGNTHAVDLVVLTGDDTARHWDITLPPARRDDFPWPGLLRAPVLVEVVVDPSAYVERYGRADKAATGLGDGESAWDVPFWFVDGGAAVMAVLLAAEAEGLGALLFGLFDHERPVLDELGVPGGRRAVGTVALGWPAPGGRRPSRSAGAGRPSPEDHVHLSRW